MWDDGAYGGCTDKGSSITTFICGVSNKRLVETLKDQRWPSAEILTTRGKHLIDSHASNAFHLLVYALVQHAPLTLHISAKDGMAVPVWIPYARQIPRRINSNTWRTNGRSQMRGATIIAYVESAPFERLSRLHIGSLAGQVISYAVPDFTEQFSQRVVLRPPSTSSRISLHAAIRKPSSRYLSSSHRFTGIFEPGPIATTVFLVRPKSCHRRSTRARAIAEIESSKLTSVGVLNPSSFNI